MPKIPEPFKKRHKQWIEAVNAGDVDAYAHLLAENVVWIPPGQLPIIGREAFKQWLAPFMANFSYGFSITEERIKISGNWAFERARFISEMTPREGGEPMKHARTFTVLWKRGGDKDSYIERYIDDTDF